MYLVRGELRTVYELAEQLLRRAQSAHDPAQLMHAQAALGATSYLMGEPRLAMEHLEMALSLYDPERDRPLRYGESNIEVVYLSYMTATLWYLGYPDQALRRGNEALASAQGLSDPFSLAFAELFACVLCQLRRELDAAQEHAERLMALCTEHGFAYFSDLATSLRGWAMAEQGRHEEGIAQLQQGLAAYRATGAEVERPHFLCLLAEAYVETERYDDGLSALKEALTIADEHKNRGYKAEMHRLKGELLLRQGDSKLAEAQNCFERAIEIARKQHAKSWELRATMSLTRLLAKQGRRDEARAMLSEIYNWFTEGFDTADLKDAKALLNELRA